MTLRPVSGIRLMDIFRLAGGPLPKEDSKIACRMVVMQNVTARQREDGGSFRE